MTKMFFSLFLGLMITNTATAALDKVILQKIALDSEINFQLSQSKRYKQTSVKKNSFDLIKLITPPTSPSPICQTAPSCVDAACSHVSKYNCDDLSEIKDIAAACNGNFDGGCVDVACNHMTAYNCDDLNEVKDIAKACSGNFGGSCIEIACNHMSKYNCDDNSEVKDIATACSGLVNGNCVNDICSRMSKYDCDDASELKEVIKACKGN